MERPKDQYDAWIVADSISAQGERLTSIEVTMARFVLAEFNTHRVFSRNSASSRAIPVSKQIERIVMTPFFPDSYPKLTPGMAAKEFLDESQAESANDVWNQALGDAALHAIELVGGFEALDQELAQAFKDKYPDQYKRVSPLKDVKVHKQIANRLLEPFMHHTVLVTSTEWDNFFGQRIDANAQPEIRRAAELMRQAMAKSQPEQLEAGQWHVPYVDSELRDHVAQHANNDLEILKKVSTARAARLSYLNQQQHLDRQQQGISLEQIIEKDVALYEKGLIANGHMSPLEHVATPFTQKQYDFRLKLQKLAEAAGVETSLGVGDQVMFHGNFRGWNQHRKSQPDEANYLIKKQQIS